MASDNEEFNEFGAESFDDMLDVTTQDDDEFFDDESFSSDESDEDDLSTQPSSLHTDDNKQNELPQKAGIARAYESFEELADHATKIVALLNVTNINAKELTDALEDKNAQVKDTIEEYNNVFGKLNKLAKENNLFYEMTKTTIADFSKLKNELFKSTSEHKIELNETLQSFNDNMKLTMSNLEVKIKTISNNIDTDPIIKNLQKNLETQFQALKLSDVTIAINQLIDAKNSLENISKMMVGKYGSEEGIVSKMENSAKAVVGQIKKINLKISIISSAAALITGAAVTYGIMQYEYSKKYTQEIQQATFLMQEEYSKKTNELNQKYQSYSLFEKRYGLDPSKNFGFFKDTNEPYFYFPTNQGVTQNGITYVPLK